MQPQNSVSCKQCPFQSPDQTCFFHDFTAELVPFQFESGAIIFSEKKSLNGIYCIQEGLCQIGKNCSNGRNQIIELLSSGTLLGIRSILCEDRTNLMAKAILPVRGRYLPKKIFFDLMNANPLFSLRVTMALASYLKRSDNKIVSFGQKTMYQRVAEIVLELPQYFKPDSNGYIELKLTREDMANLAGIATESLIRILSCYKQKKWIALVGKRLKIEQPYRLQQLAQGHVLQVD